MVAKSIKLNYIYNLIYQLLSLITPVITAPYLARVLAADGVGTCSYIESISSYFVLFATLGLTTFGQREISYVQEDRQKRSCIFWETNLLELVVSLLSIVVYVVFSLAHSNWQIYMVLIFNLFAVMVNISWFFQGIEEFGKIAIRSIFFKIINVIYIFVVVKSKDDIIWYLLGISVLNFMNNISYWVSIKKYVDIPKITSLHPFRHIKTVISLFIPTIAIQIYTVLDKTMIGVITNNSFENGYYEQATKIVRMVLVLVTSLGTVMIPRIGYYFEKKDIKQIQKSLYRGYRFVWFLGIPLCFGLILVSDNFIPWFLGTGYEKVNSLIDILAFLILCIGINNVTGVQYLIPTRRQDIFTRTVICGSVINFVLNFILIHFINTYGAAIASVVAEFAIAIIQIVIVRDEISPLKIFKSGINYLVSGAVMAIVLGCVRKNLDPSIVNTLILVFVGGISYLCMLFLLKDEFLFDELDIIGRKKR